MKTLIINYGMGNLGSLENRLKTLGYSCELSSDPEAILTADKLILPGVGHFAKGMQKLKEMNLIPAMEQRVLKDKIPILGICLGMQLFAEKSEEGDAAGLGWIPSPVVRFRPSTNAKLKVPHMGWNSLQIRQKTGIFEGMDDESRFYFVHSYHVPFQEGGFVTSSCHYEIPFAASVQKDNIIGVQFHPEKSHRYGVKLFRNFMELC